MNWGLIGASTIAAEHMIGAIRAQAGHQVISVLSSNADHGASFASDNRIEYSTTSLAEMLADDRIGAVYISSTNEKHLPQALAAIEAGKHVMCEKPLAMSAADAATMVRAADDHGVLLATNHHLRAAGTHLAMKDLISRGEIGEVLSLRVFNAGLLPAHLRGWRLSDPDAGGGVTPDLVVHDADIVRFYLDEDPVAVVAIESHGSMSRGGVEDGVMSVWKMPSGVQVMTHESFTHPFAQSGLEIYGSRGAIVARNVMTQHPVGDITLTTESGATSIKYSNHGLYDRTLAQFSAAIKGEGQISASGVDGVKSLAVAEAVKKAAVTGQITTVDYCGVE